jgi:hypothetical protein
MRYLFLALLNQRMHSESPSPWPFPTGEGTREVWLPSPWGEGLGMRAIHTCIQQRSISILFLKRSTNVIDRVVSKVKA